MDILYERTREERNRLECSVSRNRVFPPHFHLDLELHVLRRGNITVNVNGEEQEVHDGTITIIDSYDVHSFRNQSGENWQDLLLIIPYKFLTRFNAIRENFKIADPFIHDPALCEELYAVADRFLLNPDFRSDENVQACAVDLLLSLLCRRIEFSKKKERGDAILVRQILAFLQEHYSENVKRSDVARELGYTETHISRVFHRFLQMGISEYVNRLRLSEMERRRKQGDTRTTLELLYEVGFQSQQTYYRAKLKAEENA
ncbi:MAG: helix-turn-helix transcriptional regulator [Clostridia bacterium]|nr:helix-turn-helix transcriptional regulator [Clostridia bacterium]